MIAEIKGFRESHRAQHDELHAKVDGVQKVAETLRRLIEPDRTSLES